MDYKVSIIVPVYKIPIYALNKCINSLIEQSYKNIEVLLIDDGSPDDCGIECDKHASSDSRVKVIHKNNEGVSAARNDGLKVSTGQFVMFVDADDCLHPHAIEIMLSFMVNNMLDVAICNYQRFYDSVTSLSIPNKYDTKVFSNTDDLISLRKKCLREDSKLGVRYNGAPWAKLFNAQLLKNNSLFFDVKLVRSQDNYFNFLVFSKAKKIGYINLPLYCYRYLATSSVNKYRKNLLDITNRYLETINEEIIKEGIGKDYNDILKKIVLEKLSEFTITCIAHPQNEYSIKENCNLLKNYRDKWLIDIDFSKIELSDFALWERIIFWFVKNEHYAPAYYFSKIFVTIKTLYLKTKK